MNIIKYYKRLLFPEIFIMEIAPAVLAAIIAAGGTAAGILSNSGKSLDVGQYSTMTPEQQAAYSKLLGNLQGYNPDYITGSNYTPEMYTGGYSPTNYSDQSQLQGALNTALSGQPSTNINPQATEDYYRQSIEQPAIRQYEEVTRPAWMEKTSNIHSSARDIQEQQGYEDLYSNLQQQHGNLLYQDEQARRQLSESAAQRQLAGLQTGTEAWATQNQLGLTANQQNQNAWQSYQNLLLGQDQNNLNYQTAQLGQSSLQYQLMLQALGIPGTENIAQESGGGIQNILMPWKAFS
jgi:hypothetical protein